MTSERAQQGVDRAAAAPLISWWAVDDQSVPWMSRHDLDYMIEPPILLTPMVENAVDVGAIVMAAAYLLGLVSDALHRRSKPGVGPLLAWVLVGEALLGAGWRVGSPG